MIQSSQVDPSSEAIHKSVHALLRQFYSKTVLESKIICIQQDTPNTSVENAELALFVFTMSEFLREVGNSGDLKPQDFATMKAHVRQRLNGNEHTLRTIRAAQPQPPNTEGEEVPATRPVPRFRNIPAPTPPITRPTIATPEWLAIETPMAPQPVPVPTLADFMLRATTTQETTQRAPEINTNEEPVFDDRAEIDIEP